MESLEETGVDPSAVICVCSCVRTRDLPSLDQKDGHQQTSKHRRWNVYRAWTFTKAKFADSDANNAAVFAILDFGGLTWVRMMRA